MSAVVAVGASPVHGFSKPTLGEIRLLAGLGVEGDAHAGITVKHRSRVRRDPTRPNLRQVHLLHAELLDELGVPAGDLGENVTTRGLDLLGLSTGTRLHLGDQAVVEVTGLRNPCLQIDHYRSGLLSQVVSHDAAGEVVRLAGVMAVVLQTGAVRPGDPIAVEIPATHVPLVPV
jgi:hypothetical protein